MRTDVRPEPVVASAPDTFPAVLASLASDPGRWIREWNWKAALTSSVTRGAVFFLVNLTASVAAARAALVTEFALRGVTSGFYGALTARFRRVEPAWQGTTCAMLVLPACSHTVEYVVHWWRGTPALASSLAASVIFTVLSTAVNLHLMRHGVFLVGEGSRSLAHDLRAVPRLLVRFVTG